MEWFFNITIFIVSCGFLYLAGELITVGLLRMARYFGVTEFVVAFFVMAVASSLPNLFVGVSSALRGVPALSFGDIMGNNMIALTLAVALAVFFSSKKEIPSDGKTIQTTAIFTLIAAILPIILILDNVLSRIDGVVLILYFFYYIFWLFSKKERFEKVYEEHKIHIIKETKQVFIDLFKIALGVVILLIVSQGIIMSASFMAVELNLPLVFIGTIILGLGSALPEIYFAVSSAKKGETSMILGNLMGAVIIPASLILGIISVISPIKIEAVGSFATSRIFLIIAALIFFLSARSHNKISKKESYLLLAIYIVFVITVIFLYN